MSDASSWRSSAGLGASGINFQVAAPTAVRLSPKLAKNPESGKSRSQSAIRWLSLSMNSRTKVFSGESGRSVKVARVAERSGAFCPSAPSTHADGSVSSIMARSNSRSLYGSLCFRAFVPSSSNSSCVHTWEGSSAGRQPVAFLQPSGRARWSACVPAMMTTLLLRRVCCR
jgi:hypothetical protein